MTGRIIRIKWRKSVEEKNYCCNVCGCKLADDDGSIRGRTIENLDFLQCRACRNVVAEIERSNEQ